MDRAGLDELKMLNAAGGVVQEEAAELITALEEAWQKNDRWRRWYQGMAARAAEYRKERDRARVQLDASRAGAREAGQQAAYQRRRRKWALKELYSLRQDHDSMDRWYDRELKTAEAERDAWREKAAEYCRDWQRVGKQLAEVEADRDKWMARFDASEHRGMAYMAERDKLKQIMFEPVLASEWEKLTAERDALKARVKECEENVLVPCPRMHYGSESASLCPVCQGRKRVTKEVAEAYTALRPEDVAIPNTVDEVYLGDGPDPEVVRREE